MFSDAELYSRNHDVQTKDANYLLDHVLPEMSFDEEDVVMDIGCGSGGNTRDVFLLRIPKLKKLIAIDILPDMIQHASLHAANEKTEYREANIEDKHSLEQWEGLISKVVSLHCFHFVKNQAMGFQNIYDLLKPKGFSMWASYPNLLKNMKWSQYLKGADQYIPESHHRNLGVSHFTKVLENLGFEVLLCFEETKTHTLNSDDELKAVLMTISSLTSHIPDELREEFAKDLVREVTIRSGRNSEGLPNFSYKILVLHAKKM